MPGSSRRPAVEALEEKAARIAAAIKGQPTADQFHALKGDLDHLTSSLNPATCCGQQLSAAQTSSIPAALVQTAMVGLELLGKAASAASEAAQTLSDALDQLGKPLLYFVSAAAVTGHSLTALPPDFLRSWTGAAAPAAAYLQQHSQELSPTPSTCSVLVSVVALLRLWRVAALGYRPAITGRPTGPVITTMPLVADLSLLLLTSPAAAAAFPKKVQVGAPGHAKVKYLHLAAATSLHVMAHVVDVAGQTVMGKEIRAGPGALVSDRAVPGPFVSDSVQRALVLHLAACMPYCMQQMVKQHGNKASSKSSSSRGSFAAAAPRPDAVAEADATARVQLQLLGFQRLQDVQQYGLVACEHAGLAAGPGDTPGGHLRMAFAGLQMALVLRRQALGRPLWPALYRGAITRPSPAAMIAAVDPRAASITAPGVDPLLLHELLLQLMSVLGVSDPGCMSAALGISINSLQPATPLSADMTRVERCLQLLWLGLGRELLQAAGVSAAELDGEDDAEEEGGGNSSNSSNRLYTDGSPVAPLSGSDILREHGYMLIQSFVWHGEFLPPAQDVFKQQLRLACRVLESAARACIWPAPRAPVQPDASGTAKHFKGLCFAAAAVCIPASTELAALSRRHPKLVHYCGSLMVSVLKQVQLQLHSTRNNNPVLPGWHAMVLPQLLALSNLTAGIGVNAVAAAAAATQAEGASSAGPGGVTPTAWLPLSGRGIASVGHVLASSSAWLQECMHAGDSSVRWTALQELANLAQAVKWVAEQLAVAAEVLETPTTVGGATMPAVDAAALHELQEEAVALCEQLAPLQQACTAAMASRDGSGSSNKEAQVAALSAFAEACGGGGWLPAALQGLGEGVASAFPHKYCCNDPGCDNMQLLTEASAAKKACTGCKVARYCCREHQVRHWPQHKHACKAIKQALAASPGH